MRVVEEEEDEEHAPPLDAEAAAAALQSYVAFRGRLQGDLEQCSQLRRGLQDEQRCYADLSSNIEHLQRVRGHWGCALAGGLGRCLLLMPL